MFREHGSEHAWDKVAKAGASSIGAGLPVTKPGGNLVVDIGGGTTDVALISMSGIVYSRSLRIAGNHMDEAIMNYVKRKYNLLIGERMAEKIKIEIGSATALDKPMTVEIKGRSLIEGIPKTITVDDSEIREALNEPVAAIVSAIRLALEHTPPELSADISDRGLVLAGGGALLINLESSAGRSDTGRCRWNAGMTWSLSDLTQARWDRPKPGSSGGRYSRWLRRG